MANKWPAPRSEAEIDYHALCVFYIEWNCGVMLKLLVIKMMVLCEKITGKCVDIIFFDICVVAKHVLTV